MDFNTVSIAEFAESHGLVLDLDSVVVNDRAVDVRTAIAETNDRGIRGPADSRCAGVVPQNETERRPLAPGGRFSSGVFTVPTSSPTRFCRVNPVCSSETTKDRCGTSTPSRGPTPVRLVNRWLDCAPSTRPRRPTPASTFTRRQRTARGSARPAAGPAFRRPVPAYR